MWWLHVLGVHPSDCGPAGIPLKMYRADLWLDRCLMMIDLPQRPPCPSVCLSCRSAGLALPGTADRSRMKGQQNDNDP